MRAVAAFVVLAGALAATPAAAVQDELRPWTATDLRDACGDSDMYFIYGACGGYLTAVHDIVLSQRGAMAMVCLPEEGSFVFHHLEALVEAVATLPEVEAETAVELALRAFDRAFPCE